MSVRTVCTVRVESENARFLPAQGASGAILGLLRADVRKPGMIDFVGGGPGRGEVVRAITVWVPADLIDHAHRRRGPHSLGAYLRELVDRAREYALPVPVTRAPSVGPQARAPLSNAPTAVRRAPTSVPPPPALRGVATATPLATPLASPAATPSMRTRSAATPPGVVPGGRSRVGVPTPAERRVPKTKALRRAGRLDAGRSAMPARTLTGSAPRPKAVEADAVRVQRTHTEPVALPPAPAVTMVPAVLGSPSDLARWRARAEQARWDHDVGVWRPLLAFELLDDDAEVALDEALRALAPGRCAALLIGLDTGGKPCPMPFAEQQVVGDRVEELTMGVCKGFVVDTAVFTITPPEKEDEDEGDTEAVDVQGWVMLFTFRRVAGPTSEARAPKMGAERSKW